MKTYTKEDNKLKVIETTETVGYYQIEDLENRKAQYQASLANAQAEIDHCDQLIAEAQRQGVKSRAQLAAEQPVEEEPIKEEVIEPVIEEPTPEPVIEEPIIEE